MPHYDKDRLICIAMFLFQLEEHNRLEQRGILKRFSIECYGKQPTLEDTRSKKSEMYKELAGQRGTKEYEMWFLKYVPADLSKNKTKTKTSIASKTRKQKKSPTKKTDEVSENKSKNPITDLLRMRIA